MINPTELDLTSLPWLPLQAKSELPSKPCIYFALDKDGQPLYIGRSVNLYQRWQSHHRYKDLVAIEGVSIAYLYMGNINLLANIEEALIEYFDPPLNKPQHKYQDTGLGTSKKQLAISAKFPPEIDKILRSLPNISDYVRKAVINQLVLDGLYTTKINVEQNNEGQG